ncbi:MAG: hypothetical protein U0105_04190 [Candidatus Obscuribacterales bacterium]
MSSKIGFEKPLWNPTELSRWHQRARSVIQYEPGFMIAKANMNWKSQTAPEPLNYNRRDPKITFCAPWPGATYRDSKKRYKIATRQSV